MTNVRMLPAGEDDEEITLARDELAREGARRMIAAALRTEADDGDPADTLDFDLDQVARGQPDRGLAGEPTPRACPWRSRHRAAAW